MCPSPDSPDRARTRILSPREPHELSSHTISTRFTKWKTEARGDEGTCLDTPVRKTHIWDSNLSFLVSAQRFFLLSLRGGSRTGSKNPSKSGNPFLGTFQFLNQILFPVLGRHPAGPEAVMLPPFRLIPSCNVPRTVVVVRGDIKKANEWEISERETAHERLLTLGNEQGVVEGEVGGMG